MILEKCSSMTESQQKKFLNLLGDSPISWGAERILSEPKMAKLSKNGQFIVTSGKCKFLLFCCATGVDSGLLFRFFLVSLVIRANM